MNLSGRVILIFGGLIFAILTTLHSHGQSSLWREMKGTIFVHPIADSTDIHSSQKILELRGENSLPLWFSREIYKDVCLTKECRMVRLRMYWNGTGDYSGIEVPENEPLTKTDHSVFNPDDYKKLDSILSDSLSVLKNLKLKDLIIGKVNKSKEEVDGHTGATQPSLQEYLVRNAAYTCYTLWHTVYGPTRDEIRLVLEERADQNLLRLLLTWKEPHYLIWAIGFIKRHQEYHQNFYSEIMNLIKSEDSNVSQNALHYFSTGRLSSINIQIKLARMIGDVSLENRYEIIRKFSELPQVCNDAILIMLEQFESQKISASSFSDVGKLIGTENLKDLLIIEKITNISKTKNLYILKITQKLLQ